MKLSLTLLQLAAVSSAFVVPQQSVFEDVSPSKAELEDSFDTTLDYVQSSAEGAFDAFSSRAHDLFNSAWSSASNARNKLNDKTAEVYEDTQQWLDQMETDIDEASSLGLYEVKPAHPPQGKPPHHKPPHHKKPHLSVYELIAKSKYTTKLAKLINDYPDLVDSLNSTKANFTIFAPTDRAFEHIPDKKFPKELVKKVLEYHVSPDFYPAFRFTKARTVPTLLTSKGLAGKPQRLATEISLFKGLTINFYSRVIAPNIFGTNGVIHGVDSLLIPPPEILKIVDLLPSTFSTLELGLLKTGLIDDYNSSRPHDKGTTFFAPNNFAFTKLGPRLNAFLFSKYGEKYLKALLQYHVAPKKTLYSDAFYDGEKKEETVESTFHAELHTLLKGRSLGVDIARYGRFIEIKVNGFTRVVVSDIVARDGVIHEVGSVLIPPKVGKGGVEEYWDGESELSEEDLIERLEPFVDEEL